MYSHLYRRRLRLSGIASLFGLASRALTSGRAGPQPPASARLRRDVGQPQDTPPSAPHGLPRRPL